MTASLAKQVVRCVLLPWAVGAGLSSCQSTPAHQALRIQDGAATYSVMNLGPVQFAPGIAVNHFHLSGESLVPQGSFAPKAQTQPFPLLLFQTQLSTPGLPADFVLEFGGGTGTFDEIQGAILDAEAQLRFSLGPLAHVWAGYRIVNFAFDRSSSLHVDQGNVHHRGFLIGAGVMF